MEDTKSPRAATSGGWETEPAEEKLTRAARVHPMVVGVGGREGSVCGVCVSTHGQPEAAGVCVYVREQSVVMVCVCVCVAAGEQPVVAGCVCVLVSLPTQHAYHFFRTGHLNNHSLQNVRM